MEGLDVLTARAVFHVVFRRIAPMKVMLPIGLLAFTRRVGRCIISSRM